MNKITRFLFILVGILFALSVSATPTSNNNAIIVYVAKKIITMDPSWSTATAVAVQNGKILSVGSLSDLQPWLAKFPYQIDRTFADKILMPGFVEAHAHPLIGGTAMTRPLLTYLPVPNPYGPDFPGVKTKAAALAKLQEYVKNANPNEPLLAWGYDSIAMGSQLDKHELDKISLTQPILVWDASEHYVYTNSATLKKYNITNQDTKVNGVMTDPDGQPNGKFMGTTASQFILQKIFPQIMTPESAYKSIKFLMDLSHKRGITTTSELAFGMINFDFEKSLYNKYFNDAANPMRVVIVTDAATMEATKGAQAIQYVKQQQNENTDKLIFNGVKFFADDAFLNLNMVVENPGYTDQHKGLFITAPDQMVSKWLPWWQAGFHIHVHSNGNGGNQATVNALYQLMQIKPRFDHRFTIEHFGVSSQEMIKTIKALGGIVSVNPYYLYDRSEFNAPYMGSDRAYTVVRFKSLLDAGIVTSLHTDTPVAPPNPLEAAWIAVNRFGLSGTVRGPEERVTVDQALHMITINAAYTLGVDDKVGSISPGKHADFTVLEQDPYAVPKEKIKDIPIWGTVVAGLKHPVSEIKP